MEILQKLVDELNSSNSTNDKIDVLKTYKDDVHIKKLLYMIYNPFYQFYITSDTCKKNSELCAEFEGDIFDLLDELKDRQITGHTAIASVNGFVLQNPEHEDLIYNIIDKDLKTRANVSAINKAIPRLIPTFDVALANKYEPEFCDFETEQWYASRKLDGVRCLIIVDGTGRAKSYSRKGKEFETLGVVLRAIESLGLEHVVFDGEVCMVDEDGNEDFQGLMKLVKKKNLTIPNPKFKIFDFLTQSEFDSKTSERTLNKRSQVLNGFSSQIEVIPCLDILEQELVTSQEVFDKWQKLSDDGDWEGFMLRKDSPYKGKRSKDLLKAKKFHDAEYEVLDLETGPFRAIIDGAEQEVEVVTNVIIEHKGHKVSVGSGFSLAERLLYFKHPEGLMGKVITVQYFEETKNRKGGISLRFPTVKVIHGAERTV